MKKLNPVTEGMAAAQFQRREKFKIQFSNSLEFQLLNEQFQPVEVFKMNGDKFEIVTVQRAFEEWLSELKPTPRANFIKDLDKFLSDEYVLVPKHPTAEMERAGMQAGAGFLAIHIFKTMCAVAQGRTL